jgi:hypothetical protein
VAQNGHLSLGEYLASIGIVGEFEVWSQIDDTNSDTDLEIYAEALGDSIFEAAAGSKAVSLPQPNAPMSMLDGSGFVDDLGPCDIYTIVDHKTGQIIGDAVLVKNDNRWIMEYDEGCMACLCN